jgi:hypothetical protein
VAQDDSGTIHGSSGGGVAGKHPPADETKLLVGPATSKEFNTASFPPQVVACFRVDDIRFAFDSSFVTVDAANDSNDIRAELRLLVELIKEYPGSPLSVFGHADPVGSDTYNKALSGRRATVVYAVLISTTDPGTAVSMWQGVAGTENWGSDQRQTMQSFTELPAGTSDSDLFKAYMQKLVPADLKVSKQNFLAQGADSGGKGDYQGCSEFNPVLIFSTKKNNQFESDTDKTARNDANAPNRRVMVLLYAKGSKVDPAKWPCPRSTEGIGGCQKRFWANGDQRRSTRLADNDRIYGDKTDALKGTFACRFYDRMLTDKSPCEGTTTVKIRLFDAQARPLPFAPCLITQQSQTPQPSRATGAPPSPLGTTSGSPPGSRAGGSKEDAVITFQVQNVPATVNVKWSRPKAEEGPGAPLPKADDLDDFEYEMDVAIDIPDDDANPTSQTRLKNLGYDVNPPKPVPGLGDPTQAFQRDYKPQFGDIVVDGTLNAPTINAIKTAHDSTDPVLRAGSDIAMTR